MPEGTKTITGLLIAALPTILTLFGYDTAPDFNQNATEIASAIVTIGGLIYALYGRIKAQGPLVIKK